MVGDGERVAVAVIAELELAFEVGAPQIVGCRACREGRAPRPVAPADAGDQAVAVEHGMDGAGRRHPDVARQATDQQFADLAGPQCGLSRLTRTTRASSWGGSWLA